jgi:phosphate:Na+ symporter
MDLLKHHYDILLVNLEQSETFDILGNPQVRNQSREYRFQMIRSIKKNESKVKKKKYQKKENLLPALLYRDISRNLDNISRLLNAAIYADV